MRKFSVNQRALSFFQNPLKALMYGVSYVQHLLMKMAVATSLKLCIFAVRTLLNSAPNRQNHQSFQS